MYDKRRISLHILIAYSLPVLKVSFPLTQSLMHTNRLRYFTFVVSFPFIRTNCSAISIISHNEQFRIKEHSRVQQRDHNISMRCKVPHCSWEFDLQSVWVVPEFGQTIDSPRKTNEDNRPELRSLDDSASPSGTETIIYQEKGSLSRKSRVWTLDQSNSSCFCKRI